MYDFEILDEASKCILKVISEFEEAFEPSPDCPMRLDSEVNLSEYAKQPYCAGCEAARKCRAIEEGISKKLLDRQPLLAQNRKRLRFWGQSI